MKAAGDEPGVFLNFCEGNPRSPEWVKAYQQTRIAASAMVLVLAAAIGAVGCSRQTVGAAAPPPLEVEVVNAEQRDVQIYTEWIGTVDGFVNADIKAEVSGYLTKQAYTEGSFVKAGTLLFQIDPRPFEAVRDQARGQLAQSQGQLAQAKAQVMQAEAQVAVAEANQKRTQLDVDRYTPLAQQQAITQQDLDNATQNNMAARAQVQSARAQVETAQAQIIAANAAVESAKASVQTAEINLGFTRLTSPIDGVPGIAQLQVGALVSPASGVITTVSTLDPVKVYFTASEQEYLDFHRRFPTEESLAAERSQIPMQLILADGTVYPKSGRIYFADRSVDVKTGAIRIAALFANPGNLLRPGQYARVRASIRTQKDAILVPQRAVSELQGAYQIAALDGSNKVTIHTVKLGDTVGGEWIVTSGLKPNERVIVEGLQKVRQGMQVKPKPATSKPAEGR
jgi:membrane fusion protein (multidrug efflux system)